MFTTESKLLLGTGASAAIAAAVVAAATGDQFTIVLLTGAAVATLFLGVLTVGAPLDAAAAASPTAPAPHAGTAPVGRSAWPLAVGVAATIAAAGLVVDPPMAVVGAGLVLLGGAGWLASMVRAHLAQARPSAIASAERIAEPTGLPLVALMGVGVVVLSVSRILLAVSKEAATGIAIAIAASILVGSSVVAGLRRVSGRALAALVGLAVFALVVLGVVAASRGERTISPHPFAEVTVVAKGIAFEQTALRVQTEGGVIMHFRNLDPVLHNVAVYTDRTATKQVYFGPAVNGVGTRTYSFDARPGSYFYRCEFHPTTMTGTLTVVAPEHTRA